jgi:predicted O-methyltransferase YrrM
MIYEQIPKLKEISLQHNIPFISDECRDYLLNYLGTLVNPIVLEIGSAIGYSSFCMSLKASKVYTIEKDPSRYQLLKQLALDFEVKNVVAIEGDALEVKLPDSLSFDLIFIDAAKSKYIEYFNRFSPLLNKGGVIITDNMFFHHLKVEDVKKNTKKLLLKLESYRQFLRDNKEFESQILDIGDGLALSRRVC